jgi:hypothetical protein
MNEHLFDKDVAEENRERGMANVEAGASEETIALFEAAVLETARSMDTFTTDDVVARLPEEVLARTECRLLGPVMRRAQREGIAFPLDLWTKSTKKSCNCRPKRVWASTIKSLKEE